MIIANENDALTSTRGSPQLAAEVKAGAVAVAADVMTPPIPTEYYEQFYLTPEEIEAMRIFREKAVALTG